MDDVLPTTALLSQGWIKRFNIWFTQDLRNMKTGITGFIASQDAVIVIDANRKKVFTVALGVKTTHRKGEGSLPQRASPENSPW